MSILESDFEALRRNADAASTKSEFARLVQQADDFKVITAAQRRTTAEFVEMSRETIRASQALLQEMD